MLYETSPSKSHTIKLNNKDITVSIQYSSPSKALSSKQLLNSGRTNRTGIKEKSKMMQSFERKGLFPIDKAVLPKQFYRNRFQESKNLLEQFQKFHNLMKEGGEPKNKLKVYSKQKLNNIFNSPLKKGAIPIKNINLNRPIQNNNVSTKTHKIRLYSPHPKKNNFCDNKKNIINICLYQKGGIQKQNQAPATPQRRRPRKLQVTSSKSKHKDHSLLSNKQVISVQINRKKHQKNMGNFMINSYSQLQLSAI